MFDFDSNKLSLKLSGMASEGGRAYKNAMSDFRKIPSGLDKFGKHIGGIPIATADSLHNTGFRLGIRASDYIVGNKSIGNMLNSGIGPSTPKQLDDAGFDAEYRKNRKNMLDRVSKNRSLTGLRGPERITKAKNISRLDFVRKRALSNLSKGAIKSFGVNDAIGVARFASRAVVPIAIMATSLEIGNKFVDYSFDRTELQGDIASVTDLFVSETPMLLSAVAFGAVENKISGKFSGSAGSFMSKRFGGGGGLKGKAVSMAAGVVTYALSTELMKPIQESLGGYIAGERSAGLMASVVKGSTSQTEATIRRQAKAKGLTTEFQIQEYAKSLKLPSSMREQNTKQIQQAQKELKETLKETEGGFWNALLSGNVNKWTEEKQNRKGLEDIKKELNDRKIELYEEISLSNAAIIDFYSRE